MIIRNNESKDKVKLELVMFVGIIVYYVFQLYEQRHAKHLGQGAHLQTGHLNIDFLSIEAPQE